jgi:hypothetical protein
MRLFLSALVTALIVPFAAQAHSPDSCPAPEPAPTHWQLVGFTSASFLGDQGVLGFLLHCQAEFSNSRMCYSQEVVDTVSVPAGLTGQSWAWVRPTRASTNGTNIVEAVSNISEDLSRFTCGQWSSSSDSSTGLIISSLGRAGRGTCALALPVACCALVP